MSEPSGSSDLRRWFRWIADHHRLVLAIGLALAVFSGVGVRSLDVDLAIESFFPHDDRHRRVFVEYTRQFGKDDDAILVLCEGRDVLAPTFLLAYDRLAVALARRPELRRVDSLLDVPVVDQTDEMEVRIRPLRERLFPASAPRPASVAEFEGAEPPVKVGGTETPHPTASLPSPSRTRAPESVGTNGNSGALANSGAVQAAARSPLLSSATATGGFSTSALASLAASLHRNGPFLGNYVNPEAGVAVLVLRLAPEWSDHHGRTTAVARLRQALATIPHPGIERLSLAGMPVARADGMALIQQDQATLLPLSLLVTLVVLYLILPNWTDVLLVVLTTGFTLAYTFGLMGWLGWKFSILSSVAPVILVTTGTTYSVHPLVRLPRRGRFPDGERFPQTFAELFPALAQCCLTTVVGFASLLPIQITLVHEFVAIVATGVTIAFGVAMTLLPAMVAGLAVGGPAAAPTQRPGPRRSRRDILRWLLKGFLPLVWRRPRLVLALLGLLMLAGILAGTHVRVRAYVFDDFWEDSPLMQQIRRAEKACLGILPVAVLVEAAPRETVVRHRYLSQAASITAFLRTLPGIGKVDSPTDFIGEVWRVFQANEASSPPFPPDESSLAAMFRFILATGNLGADQDFLARDLSTLQIKARLFDLESASAAALLDRIRGALAATADPSTSLQLTGTTVMIQETYRQTISSFVQSLGFVIGCTILAFAWFYRDRRLVGWATAGNLGPLLCTFGFMGWWGIPIKISTITIFGIALGLAVDDTIHFLTAFRQWRARGRTDAGAARRAIVGTARGMVVSSAALFAGFLVLLWSEFEAQYLIGLLLCVNIAVALLYDLAFIPAAVSLWGTASGQSVSSAPAGKTSPTMAG